jgi:hypothetical protein
MTTLTRVFFRAFSESSAGTKNELLKNLALLGAAGLFVWILTLTYGIDLSPGFF